MSDVPRATLHRATAALVVTMTVTSGCTTGAAAPAERPAVLVRPSGDTGAALQRVVGEAVGSPGIVLADDAFLTSPTLVVEPVAQRDTAGRRIDGRDLRRPVRFELRVLDGHCTLVDPDGDRRWPLHGVQCRSAGGPAGD